jgi:organic hydroperoxide reductase OsmC/OhrA
MSEHKALVEWSFTGGEFLKGRYSREHRWCFDGGLEVPASPSPSVVPAPYSNAAHVDPEEAFVASIASCHLLTFLWVASKAGFHVSHYRDAAVGSMTKNDQGVPWISSVVLSPKILYQGPAPSRARAAELHEQAHEQCFISNSVKTQITVRPAEE